MLSEFEEKQFEQGLNAEIAGRFGVVFPMGQVLEGRTGFDAAIFSPNPFFWWRYFPDELPFFRLWPHGATLDPGLWNHYSEALNRLPRFRFNIFVQHKRPEYCATHRAAQWGHWLRPYFRFKITPHQQLSLEALSSKLAGQALVAYACPAFYTVEDLVSHIKAHTIMRNSNFVRASALTSHTAYSFTAGGTVGYANIEPEDISGVPLEKEVQSLRERPYPSESNKAFLLSLGEAVNSTMDNSPYYSASYRRLIESDLKPDTPAILRSLTYIRSYCYLIGVSWGVGI